MPRNTCRRHVLCPDPSLGEDTIHHHYQKLEARGDPTHPENLLRMTEAWSMGGGGGRIGARSRDGRGLGGSKGLLLKGGVLQPTCISTTPPEVPCCPHVDDGLTFPAGDGASLLGKGPHPEGKISGLGL